MQLQSHFNTSTAQTTRMGSNKKQGGMKEEKTRGKQTEPQLIQCVSLAHTQVKGCFQNCLLWSRTSTAFLFLPQNDRELPRRISSTLKALPGPTKHTKKIKCQPKKQPRIWQFTRRAPQMHSIHLLYVHISCKGCDWKEKCSCKCALQINTPSTEERQGVSAHTRVFLFEKKKTTTN